MSIKITKWPTLCPEEILPDPRFTTNYADDYRGVLFHRQRNMYLPATVKEKWCEPGYQPVRPDKGVKLLINDYTLHSIQYGGSRWPSVVHTDMVTDN
jgi:hypothetical protein